MSVDMLSANFARVEFACPDACGFSTPDDYLVTGLQHLRDTLGKPVIVLSGCRCAQRNKAVGGAENSQHLHGKAADIRVEGMTAEQLYDACKLIPQFRGFGLSDDRMVHVDTRQTTARWRYVKGKQAPW